MKGLSVESVADLWKCKFINWCGFVRVARFAHLITTETKLALGKRLTPPEKRPHNV